MRIIGLAGWSGSGKTTLLTKVIPRLVARGLKVSTLKHAHHGFDVDQPGKDSHTHRMAGATEVLVGSATRWALVHELRGDAEPPLAVLLEKLSPVDLVLVEGYKRAPHPKLEVYRAASASRCSSPTTPPSSRSPPTSRCRGARAGGRSRRHRSHRRHPDPACRAARRHPGAYRARVMAQLTDDCFAFSGPLLPVEEVERIIRERVTPVAETETVALNAARGRVIARDIIAPIDLPPFDNSAVDGYAVRHADLDAEAETRLAVVERVTAGRAAAHALAARAAIRIFTGAPMPAGADTVFMQEDVRVDGESVIVPPGLKSGANRRLAGEDVRAGSVVLPAGRRLAAQHVALAAAVGLTELKVRRRVRVARVLDRRRDRRAGRGPARPGACSMPTAICSRGLSEASARHPPISASCRTIPTSSLARLLAPRKATISCSPPAASRPAKPIMCGTRSRPSGAWCSGASPSSLAGRWRWA